MNIKELIKDLDPVSIIEFKNYLLENLTKLCSKKNSNSKIISSHRHDDLYCNIVLDNNYVKSNKIFSI